MLRKGAGVHDLERFFGAVRVLRLARRRRGATVAKAGAAQPSGYSFAEAKAVTP